MKSRQGKHFSIEKVNLAELERMTGIPRQRLRTLKKHGFKDVPHGRTGLKSNRSVLDGYTALIDNMLIQGITNSVVCHERLMEAGCNASLSTVKRYISSHKHLVPVKRAYHSPLREIEPTGISLNPVRPTKWIGALSKYMITAAAIHCSMFCNDMPPLWRALC